MSALDLSVVVPVYKTEAYLSSAIDSLLVSCPPSGVEIIVVNDGSPGPVQDMVESYQDGRLRYLAHDANRGLLAARITGARHARGRHLAHLDSDDIASTQYFDTLLGQIDSAADLVEFNATRVRKKDVASLYTNTCPEVQTGAILDAFLNHKMVGNVWNKLYKTELWNRVFETHPIEDHIVLAEDFVINILYCSYAKTYAFRDINLLYYMVRSNSASQTFDRTGLNASMRQLKRAYGVILAEVMPRLTSKQKAKVFELYMTNMLYSVLNRTTMQEICEHSEAFDTDNLLWIGALFAHAAVRKG